MSRSNSIIRFATAVVAVVQSPASCVHRLRPHRVIVDVDSRQILGNGPVLSVLQKILPNSAEQFAKFRHFKTPCFASARQAIHP